MRNLVLLTGPVVVLSLLLLQRDIGEKRVS
jgi:hypothetical protein